MSTALSSQILPASSRENTDAEVEVAPETEAEDYFEEEDELSPEIDTLRYSQKLAAIKTLRAEAIFQTEESENKTKRKLESLYSESASEKGPRRKASQWIDFDDGITFNLNRPNGMDGSHPSLFSRQEYVDYVLQNEGDTKNIYCVVVSTFGLDEYHFAKEIPKLLGPSSTTPCLILYGKKLKNVLSRDEKKDFAKKKFASSFATMAQVLPRHRSVSYLGLRDDGRSIMGVHHPKYMLFFAKRGLYVMISTANMTPNVQAAEGSFVQFFPLLEADNNLDLNNDFGEVLEDFLVKQSEQMADIEWNTDKDHVLRSPLDWRDFYECHKNKSMRQTFDFSAARVHLVSVVPGCFPLPSSMQTRQSRPSGQRGVRKKCERCLIERRRLWSYLQERDCAHKGKRFMEYGSVRIKSLLSKLQSSLRRPLCRKDTLIVQPTSIGGGVDNNYMAEILRAYMPEEFWDSVCTMTQDAGRIGSFRMLWPEAGFMLENAASPSSSEELTEGDSEEDERDVQRRFLHAKDPDAQFVFLLPKTLAMMQPDIQHQIHVYHGFPWRLSPSHGGDMAFPPHIKSYARMLCDDDAASCQSPGSSGGGNSCSCYRLAWFLLTSACLSRGAQGMLVSPTVCKTCGEEKEGYIEYKNFELGVLFHSGSSNASPVDQAYQAPGEYVQYKAYNRSCSVHCHPVLGRGSHGGRQSKARSGSDLTDSCISVILPVPYDMNKRDPFCDGKDFIKEPYFHDKTELRKYDGQLQLMKLSKNRSKGLSELFSTTTTDTTNATEASHAPVKRPETETPRSLHDYGDLSKYIC